MPRTEMEPAARERLLNAMLVELGTSGYNEMNVADALVLSAVSEAGFKAEFIDKDACLFAAYEQLTDRLVEKTVEGCAAGEEWPERVRWGLEALLRELAAQPLMARVAIRAFPSIGPEAYARYQGVIESFALLLREGRQFSGIGEKLPAEVEMLAVGAAEAIVFDEIEAGRAAQLPALRPAILFSVLVPFLGPEAASMEMQRAT
jgi:AcrR family transcriptional regulator